MRDRANKRTRLRELKAKMRFLRILNGESAQHGRHASTVRRLVSKAANARSAVHHSNTTAPNIEAYSSRQPVSTS